MFRSKMYVKMPNILCQSKETPKKLEPSCFADKKVCNRVRKALPELLFEMKRLQNIAIIQYLTYTDFQQTPIFQQSIH